MRYFFTIIKADYLQRTRSYSFLITLAVTVFLAYSFVPEDTANYTTLSAKGYKGVNNSAWVGYVSGIMTTVMLSYYGFLLVNSGIKKDIDTEVGLIIATTPISNFKYLLYKQLSNYLVLLSIAAVTFLVSIVVFFIRGSGYPFILSNFIFPYLFFAVPALFLVAALAVAGEVFLGRRSILQFIVYFFLCGLGMALINSKSDLHSNGIFDPYGLSLMTKSIMNFINTHYHEDIRSVNFGFLFNGRRQYKHFEWEGLSWSALFIISRIVWMGLGLAIVYLSSFFFHRFDFKQGAATKKKPKSSAAIGVLEPMFNPNAIDRATLPKLSFDYGIYPFVKTELLLLIRQGNQWMWLLNAGLWVAMLVVPFAIVYSYLLPVLLFLQVTRWSELVTKEKTNRVHYFAYAAYKPVQRMLPAQILAGLLLAIGLALPVLIRCIIASNGFAVLTIINGCVLIVLIATASGIVTGSKKLFEVFFFLLTYAALNKLPVTDYLGSLPHGNMIQFVLTILAINFTLLAVSFMTRSYQVRHL